MIDTVRFGIVGTGFAAAQFADGLRFLKHASITAVASRSKARADEFARHFSVQTGYGSYEELFADPQVDVVYVATTNALHLPHCLAAIQAGKAVLCEKPFALNAREAREIVAEARRRKVFCMEAIRPRFLPAVREMRRSIELGAIGTPLAFYGGLGHRSVVDPANRLAAPVGGGALLDIGCYPLSVAVLLFGRPTGVKSSVIVGNSEVDQEWSAILRYSGDRTATLSATLRADLSPDLVVTGSAGSITMNGPIYWGETLTVRRHAEAPAPSEFTTSSYPKVSKLMLLKSQPLVRRSIGAVKSLLAPLRPGVRVATFPYPGNGFTAEASEVIACLREQRVESRLSPLDDTVTMMDIMDSIRQQWSAG